MASRKRGPDMPLSKASTRPPVTISYKTPSPAVSTAYLRAIADRAAQKAVERELQKVRGKAIPEPRVDRLTEEEIEIGTLASVRTADGQYVPVEVVDIYASSTSGRRVYDVDRLDDYGKKGFSCLEARKLFLKELATVPAKRTPRATRGTSDA